MKCIKYEIAKRYLDEACKLIGSNGGAMLKARFAQEPTLHLVVSTKPRDEEKIWRTNDESIHSAGTSDQNSR